MVSYSVCTRSRRLAASRSGRERGWASRRQASLASCRRHIVRGERRVECRRVPLSSSSLCVAPVENKFSTPRLLRSDDVVVDPRVVLRIWGYPGARHRGETCTRGETPTRWNARIYRRREHWPYGCSSETESGAVTSG